MSRSSRIAREGSRRRMAAAALDPGRGSVPGADGGPTLGQRLRYRRCSTPPTTNSPRSPRSTTSSSPTRSSASCWPRSPKNPHLAEVFFTLFDAEGSEIYLRPVADYLEPGRETTFATAVASARRRTESAIGIRVAAHTGDPATGYGVRLNPPKSEPWTPVPGDRLVVLAED